MIRKKYRIGAATLGSMIACILLVAGCNGSNHHNSTEPSAELDPELVAQGQQVFRYDTFGDETFWTDILQMHTIIQAAVDPLTAASVGLKIDADVLPQEVVQGIQDGSIALDDPQTTLALLQMNAVVGVQGEVSQAPDGKLQLDRVGITCALCHSTVSKDVHVTAADGTDLTGIVGHRLDGWPNRDLQPGTIISLSPALTSAQAAEYASWAGEFGPGFYDPRININTDPGSNPAVGPDIAANIKAYKDAGGIPVLIPPAFGLLGINKSIYTGDGDSAHEPDGPVAYWNRYVGVTQMHGHGTFVDPRLIINGAVLDIDHTNGGALPDRVTSVLPALQAYQWSIPAPVPPVGSFDAAAAARGESIFNTQGQCASCHTGSAFTDANETLHPIDATAALDSRYANFSATRMWRTSPLKGIWQHPPYFHDGSGAFDPSTGECVDGSDIGSLINAGDVVTQDLACTVNRYNAKYNLGLSDGQRADLVQYLKSL